MSAATASDSGLREKEVTKSEKDGHSVQVKHSDGTLKVSVQDNGPGLNSEQRKSVFQAFYTTEVKGTGLGMAIAKRIVEAHNGDIRVGDAPNGAEFLITLPL